VALLARRDVTPDTRDEWGRTPLAAAVLAGRHEAARLLVEAGAN
jgi:ankyrin repeat protein